MRKFAVSSLLLIFALLPRGVTSDVITMKDGKVLKGKIVKEMKEMVKFRMPRRGRICTTFLNKGHIESISKVSEEANRMVFQKEGVRNPSRNFTPVYYAGPSQHVSGGRKGKTVASKSKGSKKRGVEARRERFKSSGLGKKTETASGKAASSSLGSRPSSSTGTSSSPSSTGSSTTTTSGSSSSFGR